MPSDINAEFTKKLERFTQKAIDSANTSARMATQSVVKDMLLPKAQGGRMPVDTGFLRNSIVASVGTPASGPSEAPTKSKDGIRWNDMPGTAVWPVLAEWTLEKPLYIGFSANYAKYQEATNGFREAAIQNWPSYVRESLARMHSKDSEGG